MEQFLLGVLGALTSLTLFGCGYWLGRTQRRPPPGGQGEAARSQLAEEQHAFALLQSYSPERAYGLVKEV